jgi:biotin transport system substrate-specific component
MSVFASLTAALTSVGAYLAIPIGPVPIVLQNLFILLAGLLLGARWGLASVFLYLALGALGLPVFAGGRGGLAYFLGPTGGYLLGYVPAVAIIGLISHFREPSLPTDLGAAVVGSLVVYTCGIFWLEGITGMGLRKALWVGMIPFLPGDALKIAVALLIAPYVRRHILSETYSKPTGRSQRR